MSASRDAETAESDEGGSAEREPAATAEAPEAAPEAAPGKSKSSELLKAMYHWVLSRM